MLKDRYHLSFEATSNPVDFTQAFVAQQDLAAQIYARSTSLVRCNSSALPLKTSLSKVVLVTPGNNADGSGAVASGDSDTEDSVTGSSYTSIVEAISPDGNLEVIEIQFHANVTLSLESQKIIEAAPVVILATRNALLSTHQKQLGLELGKKLGKKVNRHSDVRALRLSGRRRRNPELHHDIRTYSTCIQGSCGYYVRVETSAWTTSS